MRATLLLLAIAGCGDGGLPSTPSDAAAAAVDAPPGSDLSQPPRLFITIDGQTRSAHGAWRNGATTCMECDVTGLDNAPLYSCTRDGQTLTYRQATGEVTCPDGTAANIGPHEGACASLLHLLEPTSNACPMGPCS